MKVLMINKFLHPNGGSETYIFKLGKQLEAMGHQVEYFGMDHPDRCVGNRANAYTQNMDFHGGGKLAKLTYPIKTIYSRQAKKQLRKVLEDFSPDVCHLNNFNYQLTPSVILEIVSWRKKAKKPCRILYTAHDYQLVCPNHMCMTPEGTICEQCLSGKFRGCLKNRCIHGSRAKSAIGMIEGWYWRRRKTYKYIDTMICCSGFMKTKLDTNPLFRDKTVTLHNFLDAHAPAPTKKQDYVLYFGRYSREKGIATLLEACRQNPDIPFVFAGSGPLEDALAQIPNVKNLGFQSGQALQELIGAARFTVYPSEWYENCPFSVMESQQYGTPVLGADIGGIPELIVPEKTGRLFPAADGQALKKALEDMWHDRAFTDAAAQNCRSAAFDTLPQYAEKLLKLYTGEKI